jgi:glycosyltransferase involved in cell wall biosynthesis
MDICVITSWFPSKNRPNLAPFVYNFIINLAKAGIKVYVITTNDRSKGKEGQNKEELIETMAESVTVYRVNGKLPVFSVLKLIKNIKPDVIHVHAPNLFSSVAIMISTLYHIPAIATVHRVEVDSVGKVWYIFRRYVLNKFYRIIAVSNFTKMLALNAGAHEDKISIVYNSCDETIFSPCQDKARIKAKYGISTERKVILYAGNLIKIKGVYTLIESLKTLYTRFPGFIAIIIGQGEEQEKLQSLVNEYGLANNIRFLGWLTQRELSEYYKAADIFVLPSETEGHSVALLEAMRSGLPIVASDVGGNSESIEDGLNGFLFNSGNHNALADKLVILLSDYNLREYMSSNSLKIYLEKFSTKIQIENYLRLYSELVSLEKPVKHRNTAVLLFDNMGLSHYTSYLARGLAKYREINFYGLSKDDLELTGAAKEKAIKFHWIGKKLASGQFSPILLLVIRPIILYSILFKALTRTKYGIVHIQGHLPMFFLFIPFLKLKSKKICWTLHDVNLRPSSEGLRGKIELFYMKLVTQPNILKKYTDSIIVHGSLLKKMLESKGTPCHKIHVVPHIDYRYMLDYNYNISTLSIVNDNIISSSKNYLLLFGRIKPYKGIDVLINAAKIVRGKIDDDDNFVVLIAGKGDPSYFENLLTKEEYQYIHIYNKFIPDYQISDLFNKARFVVLPYVDASQSGVIPLAYTFSKPVIVSNVGSLAEYVEHGKTGFIFEAGNSLQLADYIIELFKDKSKCLEMGKRGYQKMMEEMSLERCCSIINAIYNRN